MFGHDYRQDLVGLSISSSLKARASFFLIFFAFSSSSLVGQNLSGERPIIGIRECRSFQTWSMDRVWDLTPYSLQARGGLGKRVTQTCRRLERTADVVTL